MRTFDRARPNLGWSMDHGWNLGETQVLSHNKFWGTPKKHQLLMGKFSHFTTLKRVYLGANQWTWRDNFATPSIANHHEISSCHLYWYNELPCPVAVIFQERCTAWCHWCIDGLSSKGRISHLLNIETYQKRYHQKRNISKEVSSKEVILLRIHFSFGIPITKPYWCEKSL